MSTGFCIYNNVAVAARAVQRVRAARLLTHSASRSNGS
jgi:acetoin utilization deacetylase AcuC-like enzyme